MSSEGRHGTSLALFGAMLAIVAMTPHVESLSGCIGDSIAIVLGIAAIANVIEADVRNWWHRTPRICAGWKLEKQGEQIKGGIYRLETMLTRSAEKPGILTIRCNRPVKDAGFKWVPSESLQWARSSIDHTGIVSLEIPRVSKPSLQGWLASDGPLKIYRIEYRPS